MKYLTQVVAEVQDLITPSRATEWRLSEAPCLYMRLPDWCGVKWKSWEGQPEVSPFLRLHFPYDVLAIPGPFITCGSLAGHNWIESRQKEDAMLEDLIGRYVTVYLTPAADDSPYTAGEFVGSLEKVEGNLIFLTNVTQGAYREERRGDLVINTNSQHFIKLELREKYKNHRPRG